MRGIPILILLAAGLTLSACGAEFNSIGRRTTLPYDKQMAIHLDAQQRVVMVGRTGIYCAEPSPDAIAAYAQAAALGVSIPGQGAGSGAGASQSDVASIGLRTQSITLMRDALYRLCEASANNTVSGISATQLMARSQDLTAVVVAVEQLTGATVAAQAALTHSANANATATAIGGADQLDAANKNVERKQAALTRAKADKAAKDSEVTAQTTVAGTAKSEAENPPTDATDSEKAALKQTAQREQLKLDNLTAQQTDLGTRVTDAENALQHAQDIADKVATQGTAADTSAGAGTSGLSEISQNTSEAGLTDVSAKEVAQSVENMVTTVLNKDYTGADCMVLLTNITSINVPAGREQLLQSTIDQCKTLLEAKINAETAKYLTVAASYRAPDADTNRIRAAVAKNPELIPQMNADLKKFGNIQLGDVLNSTAPINGVELPPLVKFLIEKYKIP
jgi:hypothetical protein